MLRKRLNSEEHNFIANRNDEVIIVIFMIKDKNKTKTGVLWKIFDYKQGQTVHRSGKTLTNK